MKTLFFVFLALVFAGRAEAAPGWQESEKRALRIESDLLRPMSKAWRARDTAAARAGLSENAVFCDFALPAEPTSSFDGIRRYARPAASVPAGDAVSKLLGAAAAVDDLTLTLLDVSADGKTAKLWFDLRARMGDGSRRTDRGPVTATLKEDGGRLRLAALACPELETLVSDRPMFADATGEWGLDAVKAVPREEAIRRGGYALAVSDYDGDKRPDVYVGGRVPGRLLRNEGGKFVDVTAKAGLGEDTMVKAALFADLDNDGRVDLVLQRFVDDAKQELKFYRNVGGGRFEMAGAEVKRLRKHDRPMGMAAADFNDDGRLDLYVGYPGVRDFTDSAMDEKAPVSRQAVYLNRGGWTFEEAPESSRPGSAIYGALVRPHSALGLDLNHDSRQDLLVIDDRGSPARFYLNSGEGNFEERQGQAGLSNAAWGMTAAAGDFAGDGRDAIYFSNIDFSVGRRILGFIERAGGPDASMPGFARLKANLQGNRLYRSRSVGIGDIAFDDVTAKAGVGFAGEAPAGAVWVDFDADGLPDLYVTNGLWSADPDRTADSEFIMGQLAQAVPQGIEEPNRVMKALQKSGASLGGYQRHRLFHNDGNGKFTEVGYVTGADRTEDGYVAATGDFDGDGRVDLLLRNADPASLAYAYAPVTMLLNRGVAGRTLALTLAGKNGSSAFGALVTAYFPGRRDGRQLRTVEGAVQSEPVLYLGMGEAKSVDLEILWPSGTLDRVKGATAGKLTVAEGLGRQAFVPGLRPEVLASLAARKGGTAPMDALYYGLYSALDRGEPSPCAVAAPFRHEIADSLGYPRSVSGEWLCKSYFHHMEFFSAFVEKSAALPRACAEFMRFEVPSVKPEEAAEICRIAEANHDDPAALCAQQVSAGYRSPRDQAACEADYRALNGDAAACDGFSWASGPTADQSRIMERCPYRSLWRARRSGDAADCLRLESCRAMNGEAAALAERYRLRLAGALSSTAPSLAQNH